MKAELLNADFPVRINLIIENPKELCDLAQRLNVSRGAIARERNPYTLSPNDNTAWNLWLCLEDIAVRYGFKKDDA